MPVSVPKLQRMQPSEAMPNNPRINMQAPNNADDIMSRTNAVANVVEKGIDIYKDMEDSKIQSLSLEAERDYTIWNNDQLQKLKSYEGDPTNAYAEYETAAKEKYNEILNSRPDLNNRVKRGLEGSLYKVAENNRIAVLKQRGAQQETYENNLFESGIKLKKNNLAINAGYIRKDDPGSYLPFDENISDIKTTIAKRGIEKGTVTRLPDDAKTWDHIYKDADGNMVKVQMTDIAKQRTGREVSEGVSESIKSMIAAGYTEEAQQAYEKYKPYIDAKSQTTIGNKFKDTVTKETAYNEIAKIEGRPDEQQMQLIEAIKDPELKAEVLKIKNTNDARRDAIRDRREKANYERLGGIVEKRMSSGNPFYGMADLEADPNFKAIYDRLDVKGKKAIREMVQAPKETDPKAEVKVQDLVFGNTEVKLEDLSPAEFQKYTVGLSKPDKNKYTNLYNRAKNQTAGEERASYKLGGKMLEEQMLIDGHITRNAKTGHFDPEDEITFLKAKNALIDHMDKVGNMNQKEMKDFIREFSATELRGKVFNSPIKRSLTAPSPKSAAATAPAPAKELVLSPQDSLKFKKQFQTQYGYIPTKTDKKFIDFVQSNK